MVLLNSQAERDYFNLDSLERLILYSAQVLRCAIVKPDNSNLANRAIAFSFSDTNNEESYINIAANIPYDSYKFNAFGGYLINAVQELSTETAPKLTYINAASLEPPINFPDTPNSLTTFEQLIVWASSILVMTDNVLNGSISIIPFDANPTNAFLQIQARFKYDKKVFFANSNLIHSLLPYARIYNLNFNSTFVIENSIDNSENPPDFTGGILTDETILTDSNLLTD